MSAAKIDSAGKVFTLDTKAGSPEVVTEDDAKDAAKVARILIRLLALVSTLSRAWVPKRIDFEDVTVPVAGGLIQLQHNFNGRVRWWIVDWFGAGVPNIRTSATANNLSTSNTLVLEGYTNGTATIRVEQAG